MADFSPSNRLIDLSAVRYFLSHPNSFIGPDSESCASHIHDFVEIYLNVSGDVSFLVKNSLYTIKPGDVIITRANEFHHCICHSPCIHDHFCLWISQDAAEGELLSFINSCDVNHLSFSPADAEALISFFRNMYSASQKADILTSSSYLLQILSLLKRQLSNPTPVIYAAIDGDFQKILDYININYGELTNVNELTDVFFISLSTLNRRFIKHLHITPKAYLAAVKLANAKRMLDNGKSVTRVCSDCGYADSSHFIRVFKKKFGITPHKYKSQ